MKRAMSSGLMSSGRKSTAAARGAALTARPALSPLPKPIITPPSEAFTEAVFEELARLQEAKHAATRVPEHTLYRELGAHLSAALNSLYKQGRIRVGDTVNDKYIIINQI